MDTSEIVMPGMQLKKLLAKLYAPIMEKYSLRPVEIDIIMFLHKHDIDTAKDIIQSNHLSKAHVSKSIDNLKAGGFIEIVEDVNDRRVLHINLTDKAGEVIEMANEVFEECRKIMTRDISQEEINTVKSIMRRVIDNVNKELE